MVKPVIEGVHSRRTPGMATAVERVSTPRAGMKPFNDTPSESMSERGQARRTAREAGDGNDGE